ncbi:oxidoreductase [Parafrankia colletiae]|uniref:Oxidoreductase n=1 Tax=Parafrankia colletiae TaxID=573497 RepID=A0A1S1Q2T7_9ACTN|nr:SDR family NAD(P)-dependent oxidoreductase [Parafrankia colletiae]MCK9903210.1 SDR family NAD(P)-dependent oxidoreductase [Frankia sp. Cpl3]OHV27505.1 oxidoreductase [Parafrankia colletiae]
MATAVITGGTDGIGRGLAEVYLRRGFEVLVVGRDRQKGRAFEAAGERARFVSADLSRVAENRRLADQISEQYPVLDVLVLGARFHRQTRALTADGFESNFALFYLSRFLLSHGLVGPLSRAESPVVLNFGGAGQTGPVRWDDLQLERGYHGVGAMGHAGRLNDLLGVDVVDTHADTGIRYVLNHPGVVATSFAGEYDPATATQIDQLKVIGKSVATAVAQILPFLEPPEQERLTAVLEGQRVPLEPESQYLDDARRLRSLTLDLLTRFDGRTT